MGGCCGCCECESKSSNFKDKPKFVKSENNEGRFRTFRICDDCGCEDVYRSSIESDEAIPEDCEDCESGCESSNEGKSAKCCILTVGERAVGSNGEV